MAGRGHMYNERFEMTNYQLELLWRIFCSDTLDYYDASSELKTIRKWFNLATTPLDGRSFMKELETETREVGGTMYGSFVEAKAKAEAEAKYTLFPFLTRAECIAVIMYTGELQRKFYKEYNEASREGNWKPYKIYTIILMSALKKLAENNPLPEDKSLYRGIRERPLPPTARRIFWKSFTSASLNYEVAQKQFAGPGGIVLEFKPPHSDYAARVGELSSFPEDEVILLPFEAFDVVNPMFFKFKTSKTQELLG